MSRWLLPVLLSNWVWVLPASRLSVWVVLLWSLLRSLCMTDTDTL